MCQGRCGCCPSSRRDGLAGTSGPEHAPLSQHIAENEFEDDEWGNFHDGEDAPLTPGAVDNCEESICCEPMLPASSRGADVAMSLESIAPVLKLREAEDVPQAELIDAEKDMGHLIEELGGNVKEYRRETHVLTRLGSEIYSRAPVTKAFKMLPRLGLLSAFALDLTTTNARGQQWDLSKQEVREQACACVD